MQGTDEERLTIAVKLSSHRAVLALIALLVAVGCGAPAPSEDAKSYSPSATQAEVRAAIATVLAQDGQLGRARNHASETGTLADAVRSYVAALDAMDFEGCPDDFVSAFRRHNDAWDRAIPFLERYDAERGELHVLFERIRNSGDGPRADLESHEEAIWGTWAEVEAAAREHGALPKGDPP